MLHWVSGACIETRLRTRCVARESCSCEHNQSTTTELIERGEFTFAKCCIDLVAFSQQDRRDVASECEARAGIVLILEGMGLVREALLEAIRTVERQAGADLGATLLPMGRAGTDQRGCRRYPRSPLPQCAHRSRPSAKHAVAWAVRARSPRISSSISTRRSTHTVISRRAVAVWSRPCAARTTYWGAVTAHGSGWRGDTARNYRPPRSDTFERANRAACLGGSRISLRRTLATGGISSQPTKHPRASRGIQVSCCRSRC